MCVESPPDEGEMSAMPKPPVPDCENMSRIAEDMDVLRAAPFSTRRTTSEYVMLCLIGFGALDKRDALMRVLQWTLEPLMLYSAFIKEAPSNEFEAIVVTKKQVVVDDVERWLELFNMGICLIPFDAYMQPDMVTCISRIHHTGKHWYGSFKSKSAARVRRDFYAQYCKDQRAKDLARVLTVTGLAMTPQNMLHLHDRVVTLQNRVSSLERDLNAAAAIAAGDAPAQTTAYNANLAHAYRRLQAHATASASAFRSDMPEPANPYRRIQTRNLVLAVPPVMQPVPQEDPPPPPPPPADSSSDSPIYIASPEPFRAEAYPAPFVRRELPSGNVVVYVVRD